MKYYVPNYTVHAPCMFVRTMIFKKVFLVTGRVTAELVAVIINWVFYQDFCFVLMKDSLGTIAQRYLYGISKIHFTGFLLLVENRKYIRFLVALQKIVFYGLRRTSAFFRYAFIFIVQTSNAIRNPKQK